MNRYSQFALSVGMALALSACGGSTKARIAFQNGSNDPAQREETQPLVAALQASAPLTFGVKLLSARLVSDLDTEGNRIGNHHLVYLNPECQEDEDSCDVSYGTTASGQNVEFVVTEFLNLTDPTTTINETMRAKEYPIDPGIFRYVQLEFGSSNTGAASNIQWEGSGTGTQSYIRTQTVDARFATAVRVSSGQKLNIILSYDVSEAVLTGEDATGDNCTGSGASKTCFQLPTFGLSSELY